MSAFWITFTDKTTVCVEANGANEATTIAEKETGKEMLELAILPYPANPRVGPSSGCPSFCFRPNECKGKTSCPRNYACSE